MAVLKLREYLRKQGVSFPAVSTERQRKQGVNLPQVDPFLAEAILSVNRQLQVARSPEHTAALRAEQDRLLRLWQANYGRTDVLRP